jgi:hypothetical protein
LGHPRSLSTNHPVNQIAEIAAVVWVEFRKLTSTIPPPSLQKPQFTALFQQTRAACRLLVPPTGDFESEFQF